MSRFLKYLCGTLAALPIAAMTWCGLVHAQGPDVYPNKSIRVVIAQVAGGTADTVLRMYAQRMGDMLGQTMVVDNRGASGVGGLSSLQLVAAANPDGYTLMLAVPSLTFSPALVKDMPIDVEKDFSPITLLNRESYLVAIYPGLPANSLKDFIALAKAKPGFINAGGGNFGSGTHLVSMQFLDAVGIREYATYVPYKGVTVAFVDAIAGRVQVTVSSIVSGWPHVKAGKLRALAVTGAQRSEGLPDTPTVAEQGVAGFEATAWNGLLAPAKTPPNRINKIAAMAAQAARSQEINGKLRVMGSEAVGSTPAEFKRLIAVEVTRWRQLVKRLGITPS
ncbi:MAG TPA: tripartite tricarboxylate transporter substrate-binding protein [Burkholderiales bacterium]|nr:tripartite tricarboxylate transporter substrate-binding protein [Burkholderiales bacterium]